MTDTAIPSLSGPGNLKAVNEQEGVITLTWDPVYDAAGYEVWRKTGEEPAVQVSLSSTNNLFPSRSCRLYDIISLANPLKVNTEYTYTVVAVSSTSTKVERGVEVVQNGTSSVTIPADQVTKIPATFNVAKVTGLAVAPVTLPSGSKAVRVSWDKNPNPGVEYRGELPGSSFLSSEVKLSSDGTKVQFDYLNYSFLVDGEKYKIKVTAYYKGEYYTASAAEEVVYTHTAPASIIALNQSGSPSFAVSPITSYNGTTGAESDYDVSVYWYQDPKATTTGLTYELYEHKGNIGNEPYEWTKVEITIPPPDAAGFIQFSLTGAKKPATYRQGWTYKLVAKVDGEEVDSAIATLGGLWGVPSSIYVSGSPSFTGIAGKKITVVAPRVLPGFLYAGEEIEFYAAPSSLINTTSIRNMK
jgi:hypothetical protein